MLKDVAVTAQPPAFIITKPVGALTQLRIHLILS